MIRLARYRYPARLTLMGALSWLAIAAIACQPVAADQTNLVKLTSRCLPNLIRVHPNVLSGGLPHGEAGFAELKRLGVRTIISVDGATPDVSTAQRFGMRYVHLPHGYDGISPARSGQLAKAVRDLPGPVYIHCHHGKHRSPAAAGVACVGAGLVDSSDAVDLLELAGTNRNYRGLFRAARQATPFDSTALDAISDEFPETTQLPPLVEAMVAMDHCHQELEQVIAAGWQTPANHPDLDPGHVTLVLREHFTELRRLRDDQRRSPQYARYLETSEAALRKIESTLANWSADDGAPPPILDRSAAIVAENCRDCHLGFRDNR